jgi:hypothetical protein
LDRDSENWNMNNIILRNLLRKIQWVKQNMVLDAISTMEEFQKYIERTQPETFLTYQHASLTKRLEFQSVVEKLQLPIDGKRTLDIGPAYGDTLDICHEHKAKSIHFVEWNPIFYAYNRLKGFTKGYRINHLWKLRKLESNKYDLIWAKGAIQTDTLLNTPLLFNINRWVAQVERIASPGCRIVICPHWFSNDGLKRRIQDVHNTRFTKVMLKRGFTIVDKIKNHNTEPSYPITFFKIAMATS